MTTKPIAPAAPDVEAQLRAIRPDSLDNVIRAHRDLASLRLSTAEDLAPLKHAVPPADDADPISKWLFVTYHVHSGEADAKFVLLFGWNERAKQTWNTSPVLQHDPSTGFLVTRSGTTYRLAGQKGRPEDLDLLHVCAYLHTSKAGARLGVPYISY